MMLSDVCLSVAYIGPKSITERPRETKIGTEVVHVTLDWDTTFKVKRSKVTGAGRGILWRPPAYSVFLNTIARKHHQLYVRLNQNTRYCVNILYNDLK